MHLIFLTHFQIVRTQAQDDECDLIIRLEGLDPCDRSSALEDWCTGRDFILIEYRLRNAPMGRLPNKALCIGIDDVLTLRIHLAKCCMLWDALPPGAITHSVCIELFWDGGPLRAQVEQVITGAILIQTVPRLMYHRTRAYFAKVLEVSVERLHAEMHRNLLHAPLHTGAYASVHSRKPEIVTRLKTDPNDASKLAANIGSARTAPQVLEQLRLQEHPSVTGFVNVDTGRLPLDLPHKVAVSVVYRCDLESQFEKMPNLQGQPPTVPPRGGPNPDDENGNAFDDADNDNHDDNDGGHDGHDGGHDDHEGDKCESDYSPEPSQDCGFAPPPLIGPSPAYPRRPFVASPRHASRFLAPRGTSNLLYRPPFRAHRP